MNRFFCGLSCIHLELTSRCNKNCWMCGRRKIDKEHPEIAMNYGDMDFELVKMISEQLPEGIVVQFHNNGEPLLYPRFGEAVNLFANQIKCVDTNAKLIVEKADEIIGNLDTITISVFERDPEEDEQYELVKTFLRMKGKRKPNIIYRCLGDVETERWRVLDGIVATRIMHNPLGSFNYTKEPTVPEIGICLEILNHLAIDRFGRTSICVRFDPKRLGVIGDAAMDSLSDIWNGTKRKEWVKYHIQGKRDKVPLCGRCDFWGVPKG